MRRIIVVASITLGMLLAALDVMIVSTAMPRIKEQLGNFELYSWVFSAYMLTSTVTVPIYGKLADMWGRKKIFTISLCIFILGSLLCGWSQNMWQLVLFRAVQGLGAGGVIPLTITIAGDLYSVKQRGRIQALFSSMWAISGVSGPVLGGWMVEQFHWSWIFLINVPIGIVALFGMLAFDEKVETERRKIDYAGAVLLVTSVTLFLLATIVERAAGVLLLIGVSIVLFGVFVRVQRRKEQPLIRMDLFRNATIKWINITAVFVSMGLFVVPNFIPLFAQDILGYSSLNSGLVLLGQVAGWNLTAVFVGHLILRFGYKATIVTGTLLMLCGASVLLLFGNGITYTLLLFSMFLLGMGLGLAMTTFTIGTQEAVAWKERGLSTSLQMFFRNIGATLGVTMVGGMMNAMESRYPLAMTFQIVFFLTAVMTLVAFILALRVPKHVVRESYES